jgi:hypothetical protein
MMNHAQSIARGRAAAIDARARRGLALVPTAPEGARNRDRCSRIDTTYFYYLSGFAEPKR